MRAWLMVLLGGISTPGLVQGQAASRARAADSVTVVADSSFRRAGIGRWLLGPTYRELWATPVRAQVLDLDEFAGGLTPVEVGGGLQTKSLRLRGKNGREYQFRLVRKDPTQVVGEEFSGTFVGDLVRDQMSAIHPGGSLVAPTLLRAVEVLHAPPLLRFMPDHPRLGEFRKDFGNQLGTIEERPDEGEEGQPGFAGATKVTDTEEMLEEVRERPWIRVDTRDYLKARLIDFVIGDWDRHEDQYRWALVGSGDRARWRPVPRDRDQAFVRYDGAVMGIARLVVPKLLVYDENYPSAYAATYNGRHLDRRVLNDLDWAAWDSVTRWVQARLTDEVVDRAVGRMPYEYQEKNGDRLRRTLRARRDRLPEATREFYGYLSRQVMIDAGDSRDQVEIIRNGAQAEIRITRVGQSSPYFTRTFRGNETSEIRIFLHGGADRARIRGKGTKPKIRLVPGDGADSVHHENEEALYLYDADGVATNGLEVDAKPWVEPRDTNPEVPPPQTWGSSISPGPKASFSSHSGFSFGMSVTRTGYGFRRIPYASRHTASLEYSFERSAFRGRLNTRWRRVNRQMYFGYNVLVSGIEGGRFFGFGNSTSSAGGSDRYLALRDAYEVSPYIGFGLETPTKLWVMLRARHTVTDMNDPVNRASALSTLQAPGLGDAGQFGPVVRFQHDTRSTPVAAKSGWLVDLEADYYPVTWSNAEGPFGSIEGSVATFLTPVSPVTFALRAGGRRVWGDFPYYEAAYVGGRRNLRGYASNRFAGDRSLYGNAEARVKLFDSKLLFPMEVGVLGLADAGRVWFDGRSEGSWHTDFGGGIWLTALERTRGVTLGMARGKQGNRFWFAVGTTF